MHPTEALRLLGGVASRGQLFELCGEAEVRRLIRSGELMRLTRGNYGLREIDDATAAAGRLRGHLSHTSAALAQGWAVARPPARPHVTVRRKRNLTATQRSGAQIHYADLDPEEIGGGMTSPARTLSDCLRMPLEDAVAVADSALRVDDIDAATLQRIAAGIRGPGAASARRAAAMADGRAANPFESVLRVHAAHVPGLQVTPQVGIELPGLFVQPDLVDIDRQIVIEADSFAWHSSRGKLRRDCIRYTLLAVDGWILLRFSWEDVMSRRDYVIEVMSRAVALSDQRAELGLRAA